MPQAGYVWTGPRISVHLDPDVVERVCRDAEDTLAAVPRRGLEIGGILLGEVISRHGSTEIRIEAYEAVESEHRWGPGYRLSENDLARLDAAIAERPRAVGIFRTLMQAQAPVLLEADEQLFYRYFNRRDGAVLLLAPLTGRGAVYLPPRGIAHEFSTRQQDGVLARKFRLPSKQMWPAVLAVALGTIVGAIAMARFDTRPAKALHRPAVEVKDSRLALRLARSADSVELRWDPLLNGVRSATYAQLQITDGNHISRLKLTPAMLAAGAFQYWPENEGVAFRMELFGRGGELANVADAALAPAPIPVPSPAPPPAIAVAAASKARQSGIAERRRPGSEDDDDIDVKPSPFDEPKPPRRPKRTAAVKPVPTASPTAPAAKPEPDSIRTVAATTPLTEPLASPITAPATHSALPRRDLPDRPPAQPIRPRGARVSVEAEPLANSSRWGRAVAHVPLLRRLKKRPQAFVPPKPLREVKPALTERESAAVARPVPVDVKVYVGQNGRVEFAELLTGAGRAELSSAAVYAARKWTFAPARSGDEAVPGEVILHFRFAPVD